MTQALERQRIKSQKWVEPKIEIVEITPQIGAAWLDTNIKNRKLVASTVRKYARDMGNGCFILTGDAIRFDANKNLIDGQHRLRACIEADRNFVSVVMYGLQSEVQSHIDIGKARTAGDVLSMQGFNYTNDLSSTSRLILKEKNEHHGNRREVWSVSDIQAIVAKHPQLHVSCRYVRSKKYALQVSRSQLMYIHTVASSILDDSARADAFVEVFANGIPDYEGCAAQVYRERLISSVLSKTVLKISESFLGMKATWNHFRIRNPVKVLRWGKTVEIDGLDRELL